MPEYINPHSYTVYLTAPDGTSVTIKAKGRKVLGEYYERYRERGFIQLYSDYTAAVSAEAARPTRAQIPETPVHRINQAKPPIHVRLPPSQPAPQSQQIVRQPRQPVQPRVNRIERQMPVVGSRINADAMALLKNNLQRNCYPISNNIGVGILSYNRVNPLRRLIDSICRFTDLRRTTVFVADDGSQNPDLLSYLDTINPNITVVRGTERLGVAGNTNRLLRCLARFKHGILLNDDVEIINPGWDECYAGTMRRTGLHHMVYHQPGIYGVPDGHPVSINGQTLKSVREKPQGAVLAFDSQMLSRCGYFDEGYGLYGLEHVDWSMKAWEFGLQQEGFFDSPDAQNYFRLHAEPSAVEGREKLLQQARERFATRQPSVLPPSDASSVPSAAFVIPFRNYGREPAIRSVINNARAQRFPAIQLIMVEQDAGCKIDVDSFQPIEYYLAQETTNPLFNKAKAFNLGVSRVTAPLLIMHDADTLVQGHYTARVAEQLAKYEACHLGGTVIYTTPESAHAINDSGIVDETRSVDRVVGYFEGGSIACRTPVYWRVGGFNEDFWGYGCEDCDFYARLSRGASWIEDRVFDLLHLWHDRVGGWHEHHRRNREIEHRLQQLPLEERIAAQRIQLRAAGYQYD